MEGGLSMDYSGLGYDALLKQYRLLVERANKRLLRLERSGLKGSPAYRAAQKSSSASSGAKVRFTKKNPQNMRVLRSRMGSVQRFLEAPTSTRQGYRELKKQYGAAVQKTFRKKWNLNLTGEQIDALFDSELWDKLERDYGSETAVKIIASIQKGKGDVGRTMKSLAAKRTNLSEGQRENVKDMINSAASGAEWADIDTDLLAEIGGLFDKK